MAHLSQQDENFGVVPPSTGKKKKARRVFGNILSSGDLNHSLSYTPSPFKANKESKSPSKSQEALVTNLFSIEEHQFSGRKTASPRERGRKSEMSSSFQSTSRSETSSVVIKPFSSVIGSPKDTEKETVPQSIRVPSERDSAESKLSLESPKYDSRGTSLPFYSKEDRLAKTTKPYSRHAGSSSASGGRPPVPSVSVNQALNAARRAREKALKEKVQAAASIRGQWKEEKEEALEFQAETEKLRREQLILQNQLSSNFSRAKAQRNHKMRLAEREKSDKEATFKSAVAREQRERLKEQEDKRRRESMTVRAKLRENNRDGSEKLRLIKIEEEKAIIEERHSSSIAFQQYQRDRLDSARKNYQFKRGDAIRIRKLFDDMEKQRRKEEHEGFELKLAAARDVAQYHQDQLHQRRQSLEVRGALARERRQQEDDLATKQSQAEHESLELKRAAEKDVEAYKQTLLEERRASLAARGATAQRHREILSLQDAKHKKSSHESYLLKFEAEKDAEAYREGEALRRRMSLEQRGASAREARKQFLQEEAERKQREHESLQLKFEGYKDVDEYHKDVNAKRRLSLERRNEEARQQREEEENRCIQLAELEHASYELKWEAERDAKEYKQQIERERRESLKSRNVEAQQQRELAKIQRSADLKVQHENFELKRAAAKDVEEYRKMEDENRRNSLQYRNQEKVRHAKVMEELEFIAKEQHAESYLLKWSGDNDAKQYQARLEEERRHSIRLRNEVARRHREMDDEIRHKELAKKHEDEELKAAGHRDVQKYKDECAERERASLEYRRQEAMIQRLEETRALQKEREVEEQNQELEALARTDMQEYIKTCKSQRRKSLAFRAKEKRRHAEWARQEARKALEQRNLDSRLRARDSRSMELARQKEKTEKALDALRHASCNFSSFPAS